VFRLLAARALLGRGLIGRRAGLLQHARGLALSRLGNATHLRAALAQRKAQGLTRRGLAFHGLAARTHLAGLLAGR
jgi:hypothetical protein